uniref:Uncharacterized protein n=1 Tax=Meloidogyne floridensis TaxID=298350 RepID=A0A915P4B0_9BILA
MDKSLFKAFTDKSPEAIEEFKNRIYKNKDGSSDSSSLVTTNMPFYVNGTWPSKMSNLAISIDKKCENIGEIKGSGENALCIIVRLFAFCLAIDNQFRSNEGKLLKYFRNIDVLYLNAKLKNEVKEKEEKTKTEESNEANIFNENGEINWGNEDFLMNLDY